MWWPLITHITSHSISLFWNLRAVQWLLSVLCTWQVDSFIYGGDCVMYYARKELHHG